ncbi:MAG: DNA polymerase Y family protein [Schaalia hyovaginalis]|uniref:DNA polymerase Y family protein n=1 Tax=Schaalia hyovaginalis TaxID=29316 RepID=UPI0018A6D01D|nr:DNA polymerase Y family protein [Schaalia hyovaginalis]MCI7512487.1 DNA polymerase Y family protein [Schaalia hyovaginalis]MDY3665700.1 DNA polymerase Y family protein [Schaalia hyovaginalis]MDY4262294.1 DNA polymerase Y family protein [Schaalia hyovaginalis]
MRRMVLWVPDWPVASLVVDLPPGGRGAVAQRGRIECATIGAREAGVRPGMRVSTAQYLCPDLIIAPRDEEREGRAFEEVLRAFDSVAADIVSFRPGLAWAPARPAARWHGSEEAAASALVDAVAAATGVECFVGSASGPLAAIVAAREQRIVPDSDTGSFLAKIPLRECLPLLPPSLRAQGREGIALLGVLGVHTCEDLLALGSGPLLARFGKIAEPLLALARGRELSLARPARTPADLSRSVEVEEGAASIDLIVFPVRRAALSLAEELARRGLSSQLLEIEIETEDGRSHRRTWSGVDAGDPAVVVERVRWQLKGWIDHPDAEGAPAARLRSIRVTAGQPFVAGASRPLWGGESERSEIERLVERLRSLLGEDAVKTPRLQGGWDPRTRAALLPWGETDPDAPTTEGEWEGSLALSPSTVLEKPEPVLLLGGLTGFEAVGVTARGELDRTARRLRPDAARPRPERPLLAGRTLSVEVLGRPWAIRGRWWEPGELRGARVYVRARRPEGADLLLVNREGRWWIDSVLD